MAPVLGTILRMAGRGGKVSDNFNRTLTGSLGAMSTGGMAWSIITGTWDVNGTRPVTATSQASNPLAVVDLGLANMDAQLKVGAGDALYFRVQNATNWWRLLWEGYQTSSCQQCCSTCCSTCCSSCSGVVSCCVKEGPQSLSCGGCGSCGNGDCPFPPCGVCIGSGSTATCCTCYYSSGGSCTYSCNCSSCNCYSCNCSSCNCVYYDNYRARLEKMVGGTLTTIQTGSVVTTPTTTARVVMSGTTITATYGGTALYSGTQTDFATLTKHGIGRGASNYNTSAIDDLQLTWN